MASTQIKIPKAAIRQLGRKRDNEIADKFDLPVQLVSQERRRRGIARALKVPWTPKQVALLGTMSDQALADKLGVAPNLIWKKRHALDIAPFGATREQLQYKWKKSELRKLGKVPDAVVAKITGIDMTTVRTKRVVLGIPAANPVKSRKWSRSEIAKMGKMPDRCLAEQLGLGRRTVEKKRRELGIQSFYERTLNKRWTPAVIRRLGTVPDAVLARSMGVSGPVVVAARKRHGIPRWQGD
jgi:hypothetical protein